MNYYKYLIILLKLIIAKASLNLAFRKEPNLFKHRNFLSLFLE
jgi:hypothetical protein